MDDHDILHSNALAYYKYFIAEKITIHLSTIAVAEYAVGDNPTNLPLNSIQLEVFDFMDGVTAGFFHKILMDLRASIDGYNRKIIANDVKILSQVKNKGIEGIITKDTDSNRKYIMPLISAGLLNVKFLDLNTPLNETLGELFI